MQSVGIEPRSYEHVPYACALTTRPRLRYAQWQRVRVVKEVDSKSTGLCEFKSRRCRFFRHKKKTNFDHQKKSDVDEI